MNLKTLAQHVHLSLWNSNRERRKVEESLSLDDGFVGLKVLLRTKHHISVLIRSIVCSFYRTQKNVDETLLFSDSHELIEKVKPGLHYKFTNGTAKIQQQF